VEAILVMLFFGGTAEELVEDVIVSFAGGVETKTYFFEEVGLYFGALEDTGAVESEFDEFTESG
jgi:hypothetical protein